MKNKAKLHKNLGELTTEKKQEVVQLEIALRTLKLETLDLHVKNLQIQEVALTAQRESQAKDRVITNLQRELEQLKRTMQPKFAQVSLQDLEDGLPPLELDALMPQSTLDAHMTIGSFTSPRVSMTLPPSTDRSTMSSMASPVKFSVLNEARAERKMRKIAGDELKPTDREKPNQRSSSVLPSNISHDSIPRSAPAKKPATLLRGAFSNLHQAPAKAAGTRSTSSMRASLMPKPKPRPEVTSPTFKPNCATASTPMSEPIKRLAARLNQKLLTPEEAEALVRLSRGLNRQVNLS